jgi:hypothetical protein
MDETRLYPKLRRGIVFVFEHPPPGTPVEEETVVDAFQYDLEALPERIWTLPNALSVLRLLGVPVSGFATDLLIGAGWALLQFGWRA